jgi:hypothetical protein
MNERIKELAVQANVLEIEHYDNESELQKFAELIIRECASIVENAVDHREPASTYVNKIKQHFGVKEKNT